MQFGAERLKFPDSLEEIEDKFYAGGWTDGLPIIPPTEARVQKMLAGTSRKADEVLGVLPPRGGELTIEAIAINAVMAGALPEYMSVIIAAMEAMLDEKFNLRIVQATTYPCSTLLIFNGPVSKKLNINSGQGCFGPGWRANAAIGRAVRLVLWNVGGGIPGKGCMSTHGRPAKYSYCMAENEDANPWAPLQVDRGLDKSSSMVTVVACDSPHNINDHESTTANGLLNTICSTIASLGTNQAYYSYDDLFVVLCPEHAATIAGEGFSKDDVKHFIYENTRLPMRKLKNRGMWRIAEDIRPRWFNTDDDALIPMVEDWERVVVIVAGGAGKHSCWLPTVGTAHSVFRKIE